MVARQKLQQIAARKELLRAQCEIHRCILALESRTVTGKLHWVETASRWMIKLRPALPVAAAIGGVLVARRGGRALGLISKASAGYHIVRALLKR